MRNEEVEAVREMRMAVIKATAAMVALREAMDEASESIKLYVEFTREALNDDGSTT